MNGRVSKIIRRHVAEAVASGRIHRRNARRHRSALKRDYLALNRHERDTWAVLYTPGHIHMTRLLRKLRQRGMQSMLEQPGRAIHIDFAFKGETP